MVASAARAAHPGALIGPDANLGWRSGRGPLGCVVAMRTLVLNIGNTSLFGGIVAGGRFVARFRVPAREAASPAGFARLKPGKEPDQASLAELYETQAPKEQSR